MNYAIFVQKLMITKNALNPIGYMISQQMESDQHWENRRIFTQLLCH